MGPQEPEDRGFVPAGSSRGLCKGAWRGRRGAACVLRPRQQVIWSLAHCLKWGDGLIHLFIANCSSHSQEYKIRVLQELCATNTEFVTCSSRTHLPNFGRPHHPSDPPTPSLAHCKWQYDCHHLARGRSDAAGRQPDSARCAALRRRRALPCCARRALVLLPPLRRPPRSRGGGRVPASRHAPTPTPTAAARARARRRPPSMGGSSRQRQRRVAAAAAAAPTGSSTTSSRRMTRASKTSPSPSSGGPWGARAPTVSRLKEAEENTPPRRALLHSRVAHTHTHTHTHIAPLYLSVVPAAPATPCPSCPRISSSNPLLPLHLIQTRRKSRR